jgi:hypothetical protein
MSLKAEMEKCPIAVIAESRFVYLKTVDIAMRERDFAKLLGFETNHAYGPRSVGAFMHSFNAHGLVEKGTYEDLTV